MTDNQHRQIKGYRDMSAEDIGIINIAKGKADDIDSFLCALEQREPTPGRPWGLQEAARVPPKEGSVDGRELALARTHFQEAFMHLVRAIAQPRSF